ARASDAAAACRSVGGTLVVFASGAEREELWRELSRVRDVAVESQFWIGLSLQDAGGTGVWRWDDGNAIGVTSDVLTNPSP
ncbi:lectin-like protein, partial [Acinetobacter baumannii]